MNIYNSFLNDNRTNVILSLLMNNEMYGYQIIETLSNNLNYAFHLREGELYLHLYVLEKKKYIRSRMLTVENERKRRVYKITRKGKRFLEELRNNKEYKSEKLNLVELINEKQKDEKGYKDDNIKDIYHWSYEASNKIRFKPDRELVYQELLAHLYDKTNHLESSGMKRESAMQTTVESMGNTSHISSILNKLYNPLSGYILRITQVLLVLSFLGMSLYASKNGGYLYMIQGLKWEDNYWEENQQAYNEDSAYELVAELLPESTTSIVGYQFSVPKAYHRKLTYISQGRTYEEELFHFLLEAKHSPFLDAPKGILNHVTAVDNLGNQYSDLSGYRIVPSVVGNLISERLFSSQFEMWINGLSPDAEWIELQYDFLGRSFRLKIPTIEGGNYD